MMMWSGGSILLHWQSFLKKVRKTDLRSVGVGDFGATVANVGPVST